VVTVMVVVVAVVAAVVTWPLRGAGGQLAE
jgi:hypothetical protein